jgi:hypothetical protein
LAALLGGFVAEGALVVLLPLENSRRNFGAFGVFVAEVAVGALVALGAFVVLVERVWHIEHHCCSCSCCLTLSICDFLFCTLALVVVDLTDSDVIPVFGGPLGRILWSDRQKNRYPVSSRVRLTRVENSTLEILLSVQLLVESVRVSAYVSTAPY